MDRKEFKTKIIIHEPTELTKFLCLAKMIKNIYLKIDTVAYHILLNLLVNHTKIISSIIDSLL